MSQHDAQTCISKWNKMKRKTYATLQATVLHGKFCENLSLATNYTSN